MRGMSDVLEHVDKLLPKSLRYKTLQLSYEESLNHRVITSYSGLGIRNNLAFEPVSDEFQIKWNEILYKTEKNLVELLVYESSNIVPKLEIALTKELPNHHPNDHKKKHLHLSTKCKDCKI